jgi:hypothetical protein
MKNKILPLVVFVFASVCGTSQVTTPSQGEQPFQVTVIKQRDVPADTFPALFATVQKANTDSAVFTYADAMPVFPGGNDSLKIFLWGNTQYPPHTQAQGTVYMTFIVEKNGAITNIKALREVPDAPAFTKEATRLIALMPEWIPGEIEGKPVRVKVIQPVKFGFE